MGRFFVNMIRWLVFLPVAYAASWLVTRVAMFVLKYQPNMNLLIASIAMHVIGGAMIGFVGVHVAPNFKRLALVLCVLLSLLVAVVYFARYSDLMGGLSALAHVGATIFAGLIAIEQTPEPQKTPRKTKIGGNPMSLKRYLKRMTGAVNGELGERTNPICCDDPSGEKHYLNRLRDQSGRRPAFVRGGSVGTGPYGNMLDLYLLTSPGAADREVYMDMYHRGYVELEPIPGYLIFNLGAGKIDLTPPSGKGDLQELTKFAHKLGDAAKGDGPTLRQLLNFSHSAEACTKMIVFALSLIIFSYGENREKVVDGLIRNPEFGLNLESANKLFTFVVGE